MSHVPLDIDFALNRPFRHIVIFSGAGMSADSGIPTFRSGSNGLWSEFNPEELATPHAWQTNRDLVWRWYEWRRGLVSAAQPHPGHLAVAELQKQFGASVVTQNVDNLHERAGVTDVQHLHGSLFAPRCTACARPGKHGPLLADTSRELTPPRCIHCGDYLRPGVVWFGEMLNEKVVAQAMARVSEADLLVVVGTSSLVFPAAAMARSAPQDALIIEINPEPAGVGQRHTLSWASTAAEALPLLLECLQKKEKARRDQDAQYGSLLARRIPPDEIVLGKAYVIHARNGGVGVAVLEDSKPGFQLHREKLGRHYLFVEYDWSIGMPFGTAIPLLAIEEDPPTDEAALLAWLSEQEAKHKAVIYAAWTSVLGFRPEQT
jgi:NAD-dependent deacetylase